MFEHVDDRLAIFTSHSHEQPRHEREVEGHVKLVAVPEVGTYIAGPLIGLGQKHTPFIPLVDAAPNFFQVPMRLRQVFIVGAFPHA